MIQFDNGPSGGDFVRYIDALLAQRMPVASMETDGFIAAPSATIPASTTVAPPSQAPRPSAAQAKAAARAMMTSQGFQPSDAKAWLDVFGVAAGGALALIGLVVGGLGLPFTVLGIALVATMLKRIVQRRSAPSES